VTPSAAPVGRLAFDMPEPARAPTPAPQLNGAPLRQGFVGYVYAGALKWRVMLRLRSEIDAWRGRLWFAEAGGTEVWDQEELVGASPEELLQRARSLPAEELIRRFRASYGERRRYFALRAVTDELIEHVRAVNRAALRVAAHQLDGPRAVREIAQLQERMHLLVDGMRDVAGKEGRS
jgi:hypothetical protein